MRLDASDKVELTPDQIVKWEETLTCVSWQAPAFTHLMYDLLDPKKDRKVAHFLGTEKVPGWFLGGTDGKRLFLCAERFFALNVMRRVFLVCHEIGHVMLGHIVAGHYYRKLGYIDYGLFKLPYDDELANRVQDYIINDMLIESRIGEFIPSGLHDPKLIDYRESWVDGYEKLYIEQHGGYPGKGKGKGNGNQKGDKPGEGETPEQPQSQGQNGQKGFDVHMDVGDGDGIPDEQPMTAQDMEKELARVQQATAAAMELARAQGKLPMALQKLCEKVLEPSVRWEDHLKSLYARKLGSGTYDFRRPDRRLLIRDIIVPGRSGFKARRIIMGADSSGSIYSVPLLIERWMGENMGIMEEIKPEEMHVVWCDSTIKRVDILTDPADVQAMYYRGAVGGGGTSFVPVFEYALSLGEDIDCLCYLTDGQGSFPDKAPPFPVIWGSILEPPSHYPFGDVVMIPVPKHLV